MSIMNDDVVFDELHRGHHLFDALDRSGPEVAGFEDRNDAFLDLFAEPLLLIRRATLASAAAALSIASAASRICCVASSVPPTTAPSSPLTLAIPRR